MNLTFNGQLRVESDEHVIATLIRKGWVQNDPPVVDPATSLVEWADGRWVVSEIIKTDAEIARDEIAAGYTDAKEQVTLGGETPVDLTMQMAESIKVLIGIQLGIITLEDAQVIFDVDGNAVSKLTNAEVLKMMYGYFEWLTPKIVKL